MSNGFNLSSGRMTSFLSALITLMVVSSLGSGMAQAQGSGTLRVPYASSSELMLGVGVDELDPDKARSVCLNFSNDDIISDVAGAVESRLKTSAAFRTSDFENDFKYDYSVVSSASAGIDKVFSAKSSVSNAGKYEMFLKNVSANFTIFVEAEADHGSDRIRYSKGLLPEFQKMIDDGKFDEFRQKCGTHFVSSKRLISRITIIYNARQVSNSMKALIEQSMTAGFEGSMTIKLLTAGAKTDISTKLSDILTLARANGGVETDIKTRGGVGVAGISAALNNITFKPDEIGAVYKALYEASRDLTRANASPEEFNLISYEIFGAPRPQMTEEAFDLLDKLFRRLVIIDASVAVYDGYEVNRPIIFDKYFRNVRDKLMVARGLIFDAYRTCRSGGDCVIPQLDGIEDLVFLEDLFSGSRFEAFCTLGTKLTDPLGTEGYYLTSADLVVTGDVRFSEDLDFASTRVRRYGDGDPEWILFDPADAIRLEQPRDVKKGDSRRIMISLDNQQFAVADITNPAGHPDGAKIAGLRSALRERAYGVEFRFQSGVAIEEIFALADLTECRLGPDLVK
jgi:hypothetical protein